MTNFDSSSVYTKRFSEIQRAFEYEVDSTEFEFDKNSGQFNR